MIDSNEMFPMDGTEESDNEEEQDDVRAKKPAGSDERRLYSQAI